MPNVQIRHWLLAAAAALLSAACQQKPLTVTPTAADTTTPPTDTVVGVPAAEQPTANPSTTLPMTAPGSITFMPIAYGETSLGQIRWADEFWVFEGEAGDVIHITMLATSASLDPTFALISPSNELLQMIYSDNSSDISYQARLICYALPETGRYTIATSTFYDGWLSGSYLLSVDEAAANTDASRILELDQSQLNCSEDNEAWFIPVEEPAVVVIKLNFPEALPPDLNLSVTDLSGSTAISRRLAKFASSTTAYFIYQLENAGTYTAQIESSDPDLGESYDIGYRVLTADAVSAMNVVGSLYMEDGFWQQLSTPLATFEGKTGDTISIKGAAYPISSLYLIDPDGEVVGFSDQSTAVDPTDDMLIPSEYDQIELETLTLPKDGTYTLVIGVEGESALFNPNYYFMISGQ